MKKLSSFAFVVAIVVVSLMLWQAQRANLFYKPLPGPVPPAISVLPRVSQLLASAKSLAEEEAKAAINTRHRTIRRSINLPEGRRLYGDVKAQVDGLIGYLRANLATRFAGTTPQALEREIAAAQDKLGEFLAWSRQSLEGREGPVTVRNASPAAFNLNDAMAWLASLHAADEQTIQQLSQQLLEYKMAPWDELAKGVSD